MHTHERCAIKKVCYSLPTCAVCVASVTPSSSLSLQPTAQLRPGRAEKASKGGRIGKKQRGGCVVLQKRGMQGVAEGMKEQKIAGMVAGEERVGGREVQMSGG